VKGLKVEDDLAASSLERRTNGKVPSTPPNRIGGNITMNVETDKSPSEHPCFLCGEPTDRFVRDAVTHVKVPLCERCFKDRVYPSKANLQKLKHWNLLFPVVEKVKA